MKRPDRLAPGQPLVGAACLRHRLIGHERDDGIHRRVDLVDARQMRRNYLARGELACAQLPRHRHSVEPPDVGRHGYAERYRSAAPTPPAVNGTPPAARPISTPLSVPASIKSLKSPRWPMRKLRPLSFPR